MLDVLIFWAMKAIGEFVGAIVILVCLGLLVGMVWVGVQGYERLKGRLP